MIFLEEFPQPVVGQSFDVVVTIITQFRPLRHKLVIPWKDAFLKAPDYVTLALKVGVVFPEVVTDRRSPLFDARDANHRNAAIE